MKKKLTLTLLVALLAASTAAAQERTYQVKECADKNNGILCAGVSKSMSFESFMQTWDLQDDFAGFVRMNNLPITTRKTDKVVAGRLYVIQENKPEPVYGAEVCKTTERPGNVICAQQLKEKSVGEIREMLRTPLADFLAMNPLLGNVSDRDIIPKWTWVRLK